MRTGNASFGQAAGISTSTVKDNLSGLVSGHEFTRAAKDPNSTGALAPAETNDPRKQPEGTGAFRPLKTATATTRPSGPETTSLTCQPSPTPHPAHLPHSTPKIPSRKFADTFPLL